MTHTARKRAESGFYHVVTKGNGGQIIFDDDADRRVFISMLRKALDNYEVKLHAYCLMSNHVHMIFEDCSSEIGSFMQELNGSYGTYYAQKSGRIGHVFQGRYWSEPINNEAHLLSAVRYIHANPEVARLCPLSNYYWSSYAAYLGKNSFVTTDLLLSLSGGTEQFVSFHNQQSKQPIPFPGSTLKRHLSSDELLAIAKDALGDETLRTIATLPTSKRASLIKKLSNEGFSISDITLITGLGRTAVRHALNKK